LTITNSLLLYTHTNEGDKEMKRGTKEFYEMQAQFEKAVDGGFMGYISSDFTKDDSSKFSFYANGEVNKAFLGFMAGYAAARCVYL
jgi:hypothetical protein